jgi:hypothetical protein
MGLIEASPNGHDVFAANPIYFSRVGIARAFLYWRLVTCLDFKERWSERAKVTRLVDDPQRAVHFTCGKFPCKLQFNTIEHRVFDPQSGRLNNSAEHI